MLCSNLGKENSGAGRKFSTPVYVNVIDSYSQVNKGVTVGSCRVNRLLFANDLLLLLSSDQGLQHALIGSQLRATKRE